jgi:L-2-hydroxycarboxylate dehydrogenase (NAD+)
MPEIEISKIDLVVREVLEKVGVSSEHSEIISDTILFAHKTGKGTHGITRLPIYVKKIRNGSLNSKSEFSFLKDAGVVSVMDANHGFGQLAAKYALDKAIDKAATFGVGVVTVRNSNNFGTAAYFLDYAVKEGVIAIIMANSAPAIAPWGGDKPLFGTNPIGFGFPVREGKPPIIFDMATSLAARGKIRLAAKNGESIPLGWALDENGHPTNDPNKALKGTLLPIGEHKGSGLSLTIDVLSGLLSGSAFAGDVKPLNTDGAYSGNGHFILAMNIRFFMEYEEYLQKMDYLLTKYKESNNSNPIFYPGENAHNNALKNQTKVTLGEKPIQEINELLRDLEIDFSL